LYHVAVWQWKNAIPLNIVHLKIITAIAKHNNLSYQELLCNPLDHKNLMLRADSAIWQANGASANEGNPQIRDLP
jgi:hypothetical protein